MYDGVKAYQITAWYMGSNVLNAKTFSTLTAGGVAPVTTYYDKLGRKVRAESSGFNDETIVSEVLYNSKGQVYKTYEPYFEGEVGNYTSFNFDNYGRQTNIVTPIGTTSYLYEGLKTTVTMPDGKQSSKTANFLGQVIITEDNGGLINYEYNSAGMPVKITTVGGAEITMTYDDYGNKLSLNDPDAGITHYTYDAFSNIKTQIDANGNLHELGYDIAGRVIENSGSEGTTNYIYDTAPNGKGMLALEDFTPPANTPKSPEGELKGSPNSKNYTYDNLSRILSITETFEYKDYTYSYNYDNLGRINQMTYPNGFAYTKHYKGSNGSCQVDKRNFTASLSQNRT